MWHLADLRIERLSSLLGAKLALRVPLLRQHGQIGTTVRLEVADWWKLKQSNMSNKRRRKAFKEAAERGEVSMIAQQEDRLLELFHDNNPLLPHDCKASKILNSLGDDKVVEEFELAGHKHAHKRRRKTQASSQEEKG